jgi:hypothetical protein
MSKILELNGYKYSREQFEGYKFRITFRIGVDELMLKLKEQKDLLTSNSQKLNNWKGKRQNSIHPFDPQKKVSDYVAQLKIYDVNIRKTISELESTLNKLKEEVNNVIISRTTDKVKSFIMECWTTKEQEDLEIQFIEETLKDL